MTYLGDDPEAYKTIYEIKSKDKEKSWKALINLCKTLTETPISGLKAALEPIIDVEGALKFRALENALLREAHCHCHRVEGQAPRGLAGAQLSFLGQLGSVDGPPGRGAAGRRGRTPLPTALLSGRALARPARRRP